MMFLLTCLYKIRVSQPSVYKCMYPVLYCMRTKKVTFYYISWYLFKINQVDLLLDCGVCHSVKCCILYIHKFTPPLYCSIPFTLAASLS